jgi:uncharacterized membrane protein YjfL (UPF0719 family)
MILPLARFNVLLLVWGIIASVLTLISFMLYGFYDPSELADITAGRILFAYVILVVIVGGALSAAVYIAHKA